MFLLIHKDWLKTRIALLITLVCCVVPSAFAQKTAPWGSYIQLGPVFASGYGINVGAVSAKTLYTSEFQVISDLTPLFSGPEHQTRIAALVGFTIRAFGFERLLGNVGYRGFDLDLGLRVGPGLSFSPRDSRFDKNRRFVLLVEPMVRVSRVTEFAILFAEVGAESPRVRVGVWIPW